MGRSLHALIPLLIKLQDLGVAFQLLTEVIDTATPTGCAVLQMIGVLVELERSLIQERTKVGGATAKTGSVKIGSKPSLFAKQVAYGRKLIEWGETPDAVANSLNVLRSTILRLEKLTGTCDYSKTLKKLDEEHPVDG